MIYFKLALLVVFLLALSFSGMAIRILLKKNGSFSGGSCKGGSGLSDKGISCSCGGTSSCQNKYTKSF